MKNYENNMADQVLVVKSLKVLDKVDGGAFKEIKQNVEAVKKQTNVISRQQDEYWKTLSDDGIITPIEKQSLLRESKNIDRSFAAITQQAATLGIASAILEDYVATYNALRTYLFTTLKLFDDMQSETNIDDRDTFNAYFSGYYFSENFVLLAITAGILETIDFRVLQSLTEPGEEGETAIYHGALYQYVNGEWKNVTTGAYKGPQTELPPDEEEAFFIVSESFLMADVLIVNDEELLVNNDTLLISHTYQKGYIYYFQNGTWHPEWDKTNWRYAAAFADVINITGELPQLFQDGLDAIQANLDDAVLSLEEEIAAKQGQYTIIGGQMVLIDDLLPQIIDEYNSQQTEIDSKISHLPQYYAITAPQNPQQGDFYLYLGEDAHYGFIRRYNNGAWEWLDPELPQYSSYYSMAMNEIFEYEKDNPDVKLKFWAKNFWSICSHIDDLDVQVIKLRDNGSIQSDGLTYSQETRGLRIDQDGNLDANGNTHLGASVSNKVAIGVPLTGNTDFNNYHTVIGGKTLIRDDVKIKGNADFEGSIKNNSFSVEKLAQATIGLFRKEKTGMQCGEMPYILKAMFNLDFGHYSGGASLTLTDKTLYVYRPGIISNDCDKLEIAFQGNVPYRSAELPNRYCYFRVHIKNGSWVTIINYGSVDEDYDWQNITLSGLTILDLYSIVSDIAKVKYGVLPNENPMEAGQVYNDNGLLKISGQNQPWKYFEFTDKTDVRYVFDTIRAWLPSGYSVACIGYYGTSNSSRNNCITSVSAVGGNLVFRNHNDTEKLYIPASRIYGDSFLDGKLAVLLLIP